MGSIFNQRSLARGEVTQKLGARVDLTAYSTGLATCRNAWVNPTSGSSNRPGTVFVDETRYPAKRSRLQQFIFNTDAADAYVLEFGDSYLEFVQGGGRVVLTSQAITNITKANPGVVTYSGSDTYANGDDVIITGVVGMVQVNNRRFRVANVNTGANTFELTDTSGSNVNTSGYTTYASGGLVEEVYKITTSYVEADLQELYFAQSGDVIQIRHPSYAPAYLTRTSHTSWAITTKAFGPTNAYPTGGVATAGASGSNTYRYKVDAFDVDFKKSLSGLESGSKSISAATKANPCEITTSASHGYSTGEEIYISGVSGMTQLNGNRYTITVTAATTFTLDGIDSSAYGTWTSGGTIYRTLFRVNSAAAATSAAPIVLTWTAASGAVQYSVYKELNGVYGYIGIAEGTTFSDTGSPKPDTMDNPKKTRNPFAATGDYPAGVTFAQQRELNWRTDNDPDTIWTSRIGSFEDFCSLNLFDDEAATFRLAGNEVHEVKHLTQLDHLVAFTTGGEWILRGNADNVVTPQEPGMKQFSANGSGDLKPLVIDGSAVYVQGRGSQVLGLGFDAVADGYQGNKLSIFSEHLVKNYGLTDWAYQKNPNSIVWIVRSDGALLSMTLVKEHQIIGWARHDTDGTFENVCCVPEGSGATAEDAVYFVVKRTINGSTKRYIERLANREVDDTDDAILVDASATYNGWNTGAGTVTFAQYLSGGYAAGATMTITSSASIFASTDVGDAIFIEAADGTIIRCVIATYTSATSVRGAVNVAVPSDVQNVATTSWAFARDSVSGLGHLEGESVCVWADSLTVANPNNEGISTTITVSGGAITLPRAYAVITIGMPYSSDWQTLDIDTAQQESLIGRRKLTNRLELYLESSRGLFAGPVEPDDDGTTGLKEVLPQNATTAATPGDFETGPQEVVVLSKWDPSGRIFLRQVDPCPVTICAIAPVVEVGN